MFTLLLVFDDVLPSKFGTQAAAGKHAVNARRYAGVLPSCNQFPTCSLPLTVTDDPEVQRGP